MTASAARNSSSAATVNSIAEAPPWRSGLHAWFVPVPCPPVWKEEVWLRARQGVDTQTYAPTPMLALLGLIEVNQAMEAAVQARPHTRGIVARRQSTINSVAPVAVDERCASAWSAT